MVHVQPPPVHPICNWLGWKNYILGCSQQYPYLSSSCIPQWRQEPQPPQHTTASPLLARSPGKAAGAKGTPEEGRVCVQERAYVHVREKEAGL